MRTPIAYYGGKQGMLKDILPLISQHTTYTEAFAGGAALLFAKPLVNTNVINDLNGELINFYRVVVSDFPKLKIEILKTLHSREQHAVAQFIYNHPDYFDPIKRAWAVWALSKMSFSGSFDNGFAVSKSGKNKRTARIVNAKIAFVEELKTVLEHCTIEQQDAMSVIKRFDTPETFHFLDPPYVGCNMGHYAGMFNDQDLRELLELLTTIQGKFMLTMYPNDMIQEYADRNHWAIHKVERTVTAANIKRRKQEEWMVTNY